MDLFENAAQSQSDLHQPLAERLRPKTFEDFLGENRIEGYAGAFQKLIEGGHMQNLILWGPPGSGKTTFARLLSTKVEAEFINLNAVDSGAKALRDVGEGARRRKLEFNRRTVVFVDEIHRFNKAQQDVLLPFIEKGDFLLVGATTENPSYELNGALLSRCRLLVFQRHDSSSLRALYEKACKHFDVNDVLDDEALNLLEELADGDGRRLLNVIEPVLLLKKERGGEFQWPLGPTELEELSGQKAHYFDKKGDQHYDTISAFIKSIRGSDADAGLYYLARMLEGGEDPVFIARRLVILASEDISNADPKALPLATAGLQAVELIGLPECAINLAQVVTYLASAPKSNRSYMGLNKAIEEVRRSGQLPVPKALRSGKGKVLKELGYGKDYRYSHNSGKGYIEQTFLPDEIKDKKFYEPSDHGFEKTIQKYIEWLKS